MKIRNVILWIVIIISLVFPRFQHIERPITVDELTWLTFSADFYYGLGQRELEHTYQDHHPGVTTMWAGTVSYLIHYPNYRGQGQGYMENDTFKLIDLLRTRGIDIFDILITARQLMAAACIVGLIIGGIYLWRILGPIPAFLTLMFIIIDPMIIGQTRLYSHEGLLSVLVFLSWVSFFDYYRRSQHWTSLFISGIAGGLAVATKISALGLVPMIGVFWLFEWFVTRPKKANGSSAPDFWRSFWPLLSWATILLVTFIAIWPAAWSNPIKTITHMINHTRGFGGGSAIQINLVSSNIFDYLSSIWSHPTLITWTGVGLFVIVALFPKRFNLDRKIIHLGAFTTIYSLAVFLIISVFVTSIQGARYMTSIHIFLAMTGGLGFSLLYKWLESKKITKKSDWILSGLITVLLVSQVIVILPAAPYYYTYNNPLRVNTWWCVHGAFLDQAGDYLAAKPDAEELTAMTFSPGSMMFFFPGKTNMIFPIPAWKTRDVERLEESDYLVIDYILRNLKAPPRIIEDIDRAGILPEYKISYQGRTFVWIYKVSDLPAEVFIADQGE